MLFQILSTQETADTLFVSLAMAKLIRTKQSDVFHVNTGLDKNGEIHTVRMFESVSSVMVIDLNNHSKIRNDIHPETDGLFCVQLCYNVC